MSSESAKTPVPGDPAERRLAALGEIAAEIAHELGNVLQTISSSAFAARREAGRGDGRGAIAHLEKVERNARAAQAIVGDVMSLARGEPPEAESVSVADVLAAVRAELPADRADWHDEIDPPELRVSIRPGLLARLLSILFDNALRVSAPRRPQIVTRARILLDRLRIEVEDDGPGVPPEIADRLFEPLVSARVGGTGLGLSLARRIVEAYGGAIRLVEGSSSGATFRVELPEVRC